MAVASPGLRTYYTLLVTETVSLIGSRISGLAVSIAIFSNTGHATPIAIVAFCGALPQIVVAGFTGALADRFDRRTLMLVANLGFILSSGLLLLSFTSGAFQLWHLYALTLAGSSFAALEQPAFQASVAMLVPDDHRDRANAIQQMAGPAAGIFAPAIAGMLYAVIGVPGAILVDIATFVGAVAVLLAVRIPMPGRTAEGATLEASLWRQSFDGFRYLGARPSLLGLCLYVCVVNFLAGGASVLDTPYVLARTHSTGAFGVIMAVLNGGALVGALAMSAWGGTRPRIHTVMLGIIAAGLLLALVGMAQSAVMLGASLFAFMFVLPGVNAAAASIFQAKIAPDVQGRTFAAMGQINMLLTPLAYLLAGPLADRVFEPAVRGAGWHAAAWLVGDHAGAGMGLMLVIAGALTTALSLVVYALPSIRRIEAILPDHVAAAPDPA